MARPNGLWVATTGMASHGLPIQLSPTKLWDVRQGNYKKYIRNFREYSGRYYESTVSQSDVEKGYTTKYLFSTSTLRPMLGHVKSSCNDLNMVAVPGGLIQDVQAIARVELQACYYHDPLKVLVVAGLNNFMAGVTNDRPYQSLADIMAEMRNMKECVKGIKPFVTFDAIPLPLIPALCCSGFVLMDEHDVARTAIVGGPDQGGRAEEILLFNKFLQHELNDTTHSVSLESAGIRNPEFCVNGSQYFPMADTVCGSEYISAHWRQNESMPTAVHLDTVGFLTSFWHSQIVPYFQ